MSYATVGFVENKRSTNPEQIYSEVDGIIQLSLDNLAPSKKIPYQLASDTQMLLAAIHHPDNRLERITIIRGDCFDDGKRCYQDVMAVANRLKLTELDLEVVNKILVRINPQLLKIMHLRNLLMMHPTISGEVMMIDRKRNLVKLTTAKPFYGHDRNCNFVFRNNF